MARKDREAARRRHAIERARREAGWEPSREPEDERPPARQGRSRPAKKPSGARSAGGRPASPLKKMEVGDVDRRGRVFERDMRLHPRVSLRIYLVVFAVAVLSFFRPELRAVSYITFAVGMLVIADGQPTTKRVIPYLVLSGLLVGAAVVVTVAGLTGRV